MIRLPESISASVDLGPSPYAVLTSRIVSFVPDRMNSPGRVSRIQIGIALLCLIVVPLMAFENALDHDFILYDDPAYVTDNAVVQNGLTLDGALWAFTTTFTGNWHPLTWLSHMADVQLYGMDPRGHHLTNLVLHQINILVLFALLWTTTGSIWRSSAVALLFGIHPLHVESVAWVAERKDVLSTFFWFVAALTYVHYVRCPTRSRYGLLFLIFSLGLLSKSMVVTAPIVFLCLDYWPLKRLTLSDSPRMIGRLVREKVPMVVLSLCVGVATIFAQSRGGNIADVSGVTIPDRLLNAVISYVEYLRKTLWPFDLAAMYPHPATAPGGIPLAQAALSGLLLIGITLVVLLRRRQPYLVTGWFWYLITLLPVIGVVQVGQQGMADRYTYVPLVGVFLSSVWLLADGVEGRRVARYLMVSATVVVFGLLAFTTRTQVAYWKDTTSLFEHTLTVSPGNRVAHLQLGAAHAKGGRLREAEAHYAAALDMKSNSVETLNNLGIVQARLGRHLDAERSFSQALALTPNNAKVHTNLAHSFRQRGAIEEAVRHYREAIRIDPRAWNTATILAWILATDERESIRSPDEAIALAKHAVQLTHQSKPRPLEVLAAAYAAAGRHRDAAITAELARQLSATSSVPD